MGDKSPKSTSKLKKQDAGAKDQKKSAAHAKAHPTPSAIAAGKKGR